MKSVKVYGASDDLVEIEGDMRDEFGCYNQGNHIIFSNGTILSVIYDEEEDGIWRIKIIEKGESEITIDRCPKGQEDIDGRYTDFAFVNGDFKTIKRRKVK